MDIKALRDKYGYTQEDLARLLDVSVSTVCKWEQNITNPGRRSKKDLSNIFPTVEEVDNIFNEEVL